MQRFSMSDRARANSFGHQLIRLEATPKHSFGKSEKAPNQTIRDTPFPYSQAASMSLSCRQLKMDLPSI
jgi:hypothetical protein